MKYKNALLRDKLLVWLKYTLLATLLVIIVFPVAWVMVQSFKLEREIIAYPPSFFGTAYTLKSFLRVFETIPMAMYFKNTVVFSVSVTLVSLLFDSMAGYAFARMRFRGRHAIFIITLVTMMIPFQVLMIPLFLESYFLGILNTFPGLIMPRMTSAFGIFMMRSYFSQLPGDLEEAARIDGVNEYAIFFRIMLPLVVPGLLTLGIFHLMYNWNDLLYPLMMTNSPKTRTLSAGLALFVGERATLYYGPQLAGAFISMIPLLVLYVFFQKYFIASIANTGLKD
jgi:multiple sugar transport system permease protein